jgi:hypothetical protein
MGFAEACMRLICSSSKDGTKRGEYADLGPTTGKGLRAAMTDQDIFLDIASAFKNSYCCVVCVRGMTRVQMVPGGKFDAPGHSARAR